MNPGKKNILLFILGLTALHAAFFMYAYYSGNIYLPNDSKEYLSQATNLRYNHTWYAGDMHQATDDFFYSRRPPLTGFFILLVKSLCNSDYVVCFAQCLLSILNMLLVIKCIQFFYPGWKNYFLMLFPLLFFPSQMIYANMIMAEMLFQTLLLIAFYFFIKFSLNKKGSDFFGLNIFISLAVLTKPVLYLFFIPWLIFLFWLFITKKIKKNFFVFAFIFPAVVLLVSYRNYRLTNVFQYSSVHENHVTNFSVRNSIQLEKGKEFADSVVADVITKAKTKSNYKEYHEFLMLENYKLLREYKSAFILLSVKGVVQFFLDPGRWDLYSFFYRVPEENPSGVYFYLKQDGIRGAFNYISSFPSMLIIYLVLCVFVNIFISLSFISFLLNKNILPEVRCSTFLVVMYLAVVTGLMGSARYRMAVYPILLFGIPFGLQNAKRGYKKYLKKQPTKNLKTDLIFHIC